MITVLALILISQTPCIQDRETAERVCTNREMHKARTYKVSCTGHVYPSDSKPPMPCMRSKYQKGKNYYNSYTAPRVRKVKNTHVAKDENRQSSYNLSCRPVVVDRAARSKPCGSKTHIKSRKTVKLNDSFFYASNAAGVGKGLESSGYYGGGLIVMQSGSGYASAGSWASSNISAHAHISTHRSGGHKHRKRKHKHGGHH